MQDRMEKAPESVARLGEKPTFLRAALNDGTNTALMSLGIDLAATRRKVAEVTRMLKADEEIQGNTFYTCRIEYFGHRVRTDPRVPIDSRVRTDSRVQADPRVQTDPRVQVDPRVQTDHRAQTDHRVQIDSGVQTDSAARTSTLLGLPLTPWSSLGG